MTAELHSQIVVERIEEIVLGLEVGEQGPFGDTCFSGDGGGWCACDSSIGEDLQSGIEDCLSLVGAFRPGQVSPAFSGALSAYSLNYID